jgi:serine/threonine protein kinase
MPTLPSTLPSGRRMTGALQPDAVLEGRYRVVRQIGKGGFGAVYEARDERFQGKRTVAVKEMSDAQLSSAEKAKAIQDFHQEANLLVSLKHPNLPDVSDFFEEASKAYLVMEYIEGRTLEKVQDDTGSPLYEPLVMGWALQLCNVLEYLHTQPQSIIFRDMKPSNVMVTKRGEIKLIDFGIARIFKSSSAKDTTSLGSRGYAPLEQYGQGQSDARSDIYALGATLFDLLTHMTPVDAVTRRINPTTFMQPRQANPSISPNVEKIILKAMEEDPGKRFQSVGAMHQAIVSSGLATPLAALPTTPPPSINPLIAAGGAQVQQSIQSPPIVGNALPPRPPRMSRRTLLIGGAAVIVVSAGAAIYATTSSQRSAGPPAVISATLPISLTFSTEKQKWIEDAIEGFYQSGNAIYQGKKIQIQPDMSGSLDVANAILNGQKQPVAWSPASSLEIDRLNNAWQQKHGGQSIVITSDLKPLVLSPLVFAMWEERAAAFLKKYSSVDWSTIYSALGLKNGWADIAGRPDWQSLNLGQTRPDLSNSGLISIVLLAYSYYKKTRGLAIATVDDPAFLAYFKVFEDAVNTFGRSSGTYLENEVILKGPGAHDITFTYENLVLTSQDEVKQRQPGQRLRMYYPEVTLDSDHPFALLQAPWIKPEMQAAATAFRDFLLADPQQRLALQYGLRPTSQNIHITDKDAHNLFTSSNIRSDIHHDYNIASNPAGAVVDELIKQWRKQYNDAATGNG